MRHKHCQSAEDVFSRSVKAQSKERRQNPRPPHKMKVHRSAPSTHTGTFDVSHPSSSISAMMEDQDKPERDVYTNTRLTSKEDVEDMEPWERFRNSFANRSPLFTPTSTERVRQVRCTCSHQRHGSPCNTCSKPDNLVSDVYCCEVEGNIVARSTSSVGIQANLIRCRACRQPTKFCKNTKSSSDSDSESSLCESPCSSCQNNEDRQKWDCRSVRKDVDRSSSVNGIPDVIKHEFTDDEDLKTAQSKPDTKVVLSKFIHRVCRVEFPGCYVKVLLLVLVALMVISYIGSGASLHAFIPSIDLYFLSLKNTVSLPVEKPPTILEKFANYLFGTTFIPKISYSLITYFF